MNTTPHTISVRPASSGDVALIHRFILDLAEYERLLPECTVTEEDLRSSLFGSHPDAEVILAFYLDVPAGFALFFHNYSTFLGRRGLYLEDLFVRPEFRGKGIGRRLLSELAAIAELRQCGRMEWWVLDWNKLAIQFYEQLGAKPMSDWTVFRLDASKIGDLARGSQADDAAGTAGTTRGVKRSE